MGAVEAVAEVDLATGGGLLRLGLKAPVDDLGGGAGMLPVEVLDLHTDSCLAALGGGVEAAQEGRAAGHGENRRRRRSTDE
ncbi:hypothetical protein [Streptomyces sp. NPDC001100]